MPENQYVFMELDKANSFIYWEWLSTTIDLTEEEYLVISKKMFELIVQHKPENLLGNTKNFNLPLVPDLQSEMAKNAQKAINAFVKKIAHISPVDMISELSVEQLWEENIEKKYEEKYFTSVEEAKKRLFE